ncbi:hypothetical protein A2Z10_02915 [Candidatus Azambacteria bacterium RBG_16_47_10]|uniref:Uncharacterized protein n=1 Tax=Candidatus Azambacteria bacterium RBG_16_47_10 TaxID=1797292 RepID=A0A1F5B0S4_9BACT|nr:MAG: hypothetical protein A2Z10_02915 [Candidatus Azambacteria bacterium RBG_16_47_10]
MSTASEEKIYKEVKELRKETKALKELLFLVIKDAEGEYKKSFVKRIVKKSGAHPRFLFTDKKDFLSRVAS